MAVYMRAPEGKSKVLTFSYDDGVEQDIKLIKILDDHNMKGTFNINSGEFAANGTVYPKGQVHRRMTEKMCSEVYRNHEVAIHALTHPFLERLSAEQITYEILTDRINLEKLTGKIVRGMAYPFGTYNDAVISVLKNCGVAYSRTTRQTMDFKVPQNWLALDSTCHHNNPELMSLADRFLKMDVVNREMQLFYLWGHSYEFEGKDNWDVIERFTDVMADKSDIWYATNIEIYDYVHAFHELRFDVLQTQCYNPTATKLWFASKKSTYCINPGETLRL